jgi:hypothetical protein
MIIAVAFAEAIAIYALVVALILKFCAVMLSRDRGKVHGTLGEIGSRRPPPPRALH